MKLKRIVSLQFLCCMVYFMSYVTRLDYAASLAAIVEDLNITKQIASIAVTGSFITYGVGQIISGVLGDMIKPRKLIALGLAGSSLINLSMAFLPNIHWMTGFWCFSGFFQALLWPPLVRLRADNMTTKEYTEAVVSVSASASVATILIYFIVPATLAVSGWRLVFVLAAVCGLGSTLVWLRGTGNIREGNPVPQTEKGAAAVESRLSAVIPLLIPIMAAICLQGILRDGITTWMPTYIYEVFDLGLSMSILTTAILPVFGIISMKVAARVNRAVGNEVKTAMLLFAFSFAAAIIMVPLFSRSVVLCAIMMAVITGCMHGVNLMLIGNLPAYFAKYGKVSTVSGLLNACTYIGSALSTYGFAALSDKFGWGFTIASWAVIAGSGMVICIILTGKWKRFCEE